MCEKEDFKNNGYTDDIPFRLEELICPDISGMEEFYEL